MGEDPKSDSRDLCIDRNVGELLQLECSEEEKMMGAAFSLLFILI